ncbi:hypothetical protein BO70DRAFT_45555 [Aspergillus heteromorphus CBS 117.55]|uniref:Uncharacterized protein n=1 Tax=Aspergillus heteromorphus CBS 117.55 TaxID=1448321 RepID=A0A317W4R0_9EURO|nr:uncharacterized protein BO70DRAFT_45555 [Aspergillus heteromorphus CBS 117.55]PWY80551.1 hypothetical protein BO70DRAFT_45555 [Aspergillus heteromorphus CBS 117.55]
MVFQPGWRSLTPRSPGRSSGSAPAPVGPTGPPAGCHLLSATAHWTLDFGFWIFGFLDFCSIHGFGCPCDQLSLVAAVPVAWHLFI